MTNLNRQIVIVDDETDILDMLSEDFKAAGYKVWCAENISSGLALVRSINPSVVITDMHLPLGGGKDLFDEVLGFPKEVRPKMIFITGNTLMPVDVAYDQGAEGYITKPFIRNDVVEYVGWLNESVPQRWIVNSKENKKAKMAIDLEFPDRQMALQTKGIGFGRGGLFIRMKDEFPEVGDLVDLNIVFEVFQNSKPGRIKGQAVVRWKRDSESETDPALPLGIGVEFTQLDSESAKFLTEEAQILDLMSYIPKD
jgi:CheY-like chemotaxis protein